MVLRGVRRGVKSRRISRFGLKFWLLAILLPLGGYFLLFVLLVPVENGSVLGLHLLEELVLQL